MARMLAGDAPVEVTPPSAARAPGYLSGRQRLSAPLPPHDWQISASLAVRPGLKHVMHMCLEAITHLPNHIT